MSKSQVPYEAMNASEKTKYIGFKIFSDRELKDRQKAAVERRTKGTIKFLQSILSQPDLELGSHMDDTKLAPFFKDAINTFYDEAVKDGLTTNDLEGIMNNIIQIAYMFKRTSTEASTEIMRFNYALAGENNVNDAPIQNLLKISQLAKELIPKEPSQYDNEPSLGQSNSDEVVDAVTETKE